MPDGSLPDGGHDCTGDPEWCDGRDNDCDGVVDKGEPRPDSSVTHTLPYDGAVWMMANNEDISCRPRFLQRVWPTLGTSETESFLETYRRLGPAPFKEAVYDAHSA